MKLTPSVRNALERLIAAPIPSVEVNPGVARKLRDERWATDVDLPSPYKTHKGRLTGHLQITEQGRTTLAKSK